MLNKSFTTLTNHQLILLVRQLENIDGSESYLIHELFQFIKPKLENIINELLRDFALARAESDYSEAQWHLDSIDSLAWFVDAATHGHGLNLLNEENK